MQIKLNHFLRKQKYDLCDIHMKNANEDFAMLIEFKYGVYR